jgi:hypothetical protein
LPFYFIRNGGEADVSGWIPLTTRAATAVVFDAMTGTRGVAQTRRASEDTLEVRLSVPAHGSLIVVPAAGASGEPFPMMTSAGPSIAIAGPWQVSVVDGGPDRPPEQSIGALASWTSFAGDEWKRFSGTARYTARFARPPGDAVAWQLDLGAVRESARVTLNGRELGTLIGPAFDVTIDRAQLTADNVLVVEVANLMANRMAALDKAGAGWKKFYNVNFPAKLPQNRGADGLFSAAGWEPLDSGLLGPVTLTPLLRQP